jgi:nucleotide-binding universal stress UspA family protein
VERIVEAGNAADLIYQYAEKFAVDLLVLGSPTRELAEEDFHSSTVLQVISKVRCPVLCLPAQSDLSAAKLSPEAAMMSSVAG